MKPERHDRHWTRAEDRKLSDLWGEGVALAEMAAALGRTPLTTYWRGRHLGLQCGAPAHGEYLTHAAARTGYAVKQLRMILCAAGVRLRPTISRPSAKTTRTYYWVDAVDVDEAVKFWLSTEPAMTAAKRHGLCGETITKLMAAAGVKPLRCHHGRRRAKHHLRFPTAEIDRAVALFLAQQSVSAHARRLGIHRQTLATRLRKAGLLGEKRPGAGGKARLTIEAVDTAIGRAA